MKLAILASILIIALPTLALSERTPALTGHSTIAFIENKGQVIDQNKNPNPAVLYLLNTPGMNVQLRRSGFSYDVYSVEKSKIKSQKSNEGFPPADEPSRIPDPASSIQYPVSSIQYPASSIQFHRIDFDLAGSNPDCKIITSEPSSNYMNYYTTGTPVEGVTGVRSYKTITYKDIYPGIDLEFVSGNKTAFKYTFIVRPGGSLSSIRFKVSGPDNIIDKGNDLLINTRAGDIEEVIPSCYYAFSDQDSKTPVICRFKKEFNHLFSFSSDDEIPANAVLYIDPIPTRRWGTYFGGSEGESTSGNSCITDESGNILISGETVSTDNIATAGAFQTTLSGSEDAFLAKFTAAGEQLWGTYLGGNTETDGFSCAIDRFGNYYLCGFTNSTTGLVTPGAFQTTLHGTIDAFLAKFDPAGFRIWCTYYGGNESGNPTAYPIDQFFTCCCDTSGNVICSGRTFSPDYISTPGSSQPVYGGNGDAMLVKFSGTGQRLWATYYGGSDVETSGTCAISKNGSIYITGATRSTNNISTPGCFQPSLASITDVFFASFSSGGALQWGTYFGGEMDESGDACIVDTSNNVYFVGITGSVTQIATPGSFQETLPFPFGSAGFLEKFTSAGTRLWGTYYGWSNDLEALAVDDSGYVFASGRCFAYDPHNFSPGAYQTVYRGSSEAQLVKFTSSGQRVWGTYYGGMGFEYGTACAVDHNDNIYLYGYTSSDNNKGSQTSLCTRDPLANYIATPGSHQFEKGADPWGDAFLVKFADCRSPDTALIINGPSTLCQNSTGVVFSIDPIPAATDYAWCVTGDLTITSGQHTTSITVNVGSSLGTDTISVYGINSCDNGFPKVITRRVYPRPVPVITGNPSPMQGSVYTYSTAAGMTNYQWTFSPGGTLISGGGNADPFIEIQWNGSGAQWLRVNYNDLNGCPATAPTQLDINVTTTLTVDFTAPDTVCPGANVTIANLTQGGTTYYWNFCSGSANNNPTGVNIGNPGVQMSIPTYLTLVRQGNDCFSFISCQGVGVIRYYHGSSFANSPISWTNLGTFGLITFNQEGIQVKYDNGSWYGFVNSDTKIVRMDFGNSLWNTPTAVAFGPYPSFTFAHGLVITQEGADWLGFIVCQGSSILARLEFGSSLGNIPVYTNFGNLGVLNTPYSFCLVKEGTNWYALATMTGNSLARISFGNSLLNTPTAQNLGNPGGFNFAVGLTLIRDCESTTGYWTNYQSNGTLGKLTFPAGVAGTVTGQLLGNIGGLSSPHSFSELFRQNDTLFAYITNRANGTLTRLTFPPCSNASMPSSSLYDPPPFSYSTPGTYNIHLVVDEGLPTMTSLCKPVVVALPQAVNLGPDINACTGTAVSLDAGAGFSSYLWSTSDTVQTITVNQSGTYWVRATRWGCTTVDTVNVTTIIPPAVELGTDQNICSGQTATFDAGPCTGCIYQWSNLSTGQMNIGTGQTYTTGQAGQYMVTVTDQHFCQNRDTILLATTPGNPVGITITASANPVCAGTQVTFTGAAMHGGFNPSYQWLVNGSTVGSNQPTYTYAPSNGDLIQCILTSSETCATNNPATSNPYPVSVSPLLPVSITVSASANPVCSGTSVTFTATPINGGTNPHYQWQVNGLNAGPNQPTYSYIPSNGDDVRCILTSSETCTVNNPITSNTLLITINNPPVVSFTACFDTITTTNAKPIKLKGGIPPGGTYSGPGVTNGIFYPSVAGTGTKTIIYTYTNAALCSASAIARIVIRQSSIVNCGTLLTDIRDGKTYPTVQIGTQCWLAANLDYGSEIPYTQTQRDNCIPERYFNPTSGLGPLTSVYQWDELMRYDDTPGQQGLCPPGWHVPTENDWNNLFSFYINNGFAGSPLKYSGYSGFNALLSGVVVMNKGWKYQGFASFFWSSTPSGINKSWSHGMNEDDPSVSVYPSFRSNAYSVRCLKDN
jgi:uncharacterized protein (TIGR02145 family)